MYIYDIKVISSDNALSDIENKPCVEMITFTQNGKPLVKNINVISSVDEEDVLSNNLPDGTVVDGVLVSDEDNSWEVSASNTKTQSELQLIELPTIDLNEVVIIPPIMSSGDKPIVLNKNYEDKVQYEYTQWTPNL